MACVLRQRSNRFPSLHPPSCQCECNTKVDCNKNNKNALQLLLENRNDETCCPLKANVKWHPTNQRNNNNINKSYLFAGHEERKKNNNNNNNRRSPAIETIISRQKKNFHFAWKWFIDALSKCQEARQIYQWSVCVSLVSSYSQNYLKGAMIDSWLVAFVFVAVQLNRNNSAIRYRKKNCVSAAEAVATNKSEIKMKSMYAHVHMHMHS